MMEGARSASSDAGSPAKPVPFGDQQSMKTFFYGIIFGALCTYLYVTNGAYLESTLSAMLSWRNSAQSSVYGYGGKHPN